MLSSDENRFNQAKPIYQQALNQAGHKHTLVYNKPDDDSKRKSRNRKRNICWFNPPYDLTVKTNIGKKTLMLQDKHFKKEKNERMAKRGKTEKYQNIANEFEIKYAKAAEMYMRNKIEG